MFIELVIAMQMVKTMMTREATAPVSVCRPVTMSPVLTPIMAPRIIGRIEPSEQPQ